MKREPIDESDADAGCLRLARRPGGEESGVKPELQYSSGTRIVEPCQLPIRKPAPRLSNRTVDFSLDQRIDVVVRQQPQIDRCSDESGIANYSVAHLNIDALR